MSRGAGRAIADTVVLRYFLFVDRWDLLIQVLGMPIAVPRIVYDADEGAVPERSMSEMTRSVLVQRRFASDRSLPASDRSAARARADQLEEIHNAYSRGEVEVIDMTEAEVSLFAKLASRDHVHEFGLAFAIDAGEAACVAIAVERGWMLATDDSDALKAMRKIRARHPYQRIRRILRTAAESGLISRGDANAIHMEMRRAGFWDSESPFPRG